MKCKNGLLMSLVAVAGITTFAAALPEWQPTRFQLRAGSASAELVLSEGTRFSLHPIEKSGVITALIDSKMIVVTNRAMLEIVAGINSIFIQADEILSRPYPLSALAEKPTGKEVYLLKTGDALAELRVNKEAKVTLGSRPHEEVKLAVDAIDGKTLYMTNGVLAVVSGTNSISVEAAEVILKRW